MSAVQHNHFEKVPSDEEEAPVLRSYQRTSSGSKLVVDDDDDDGSVGPSAPETLSAVVGSARGGLLQRLSHLSMDGSNHLDNDSCMQQNGNRHRLASLFGMLACVVISLVLLLHAAQWNSNGRHHFFGEHGGSSSDNPVLYEGSTPYQLQTADSCAAGPDPVQTWRERSSIDNLQHGAVAADHPVCSQIGLDILQQHGGNAIDAAVATALCLGVANPSSSGIGGGAFLLIHTDPMMNEANTVNPLHRHRPAPQFHDARDEKQELSLVEPGKITEVIDCREVAGSRATTDMYIKDGAAEDASVFGGLAIGVPGELRGLELAHYRHGRLLWETIVQPAMELARNGVAVYPHLAHDIRLMHHYKDNHGGFELLLPLLTNNNDWDQYLREGDIMTNPTLADTLEAVMHEGADALYTSERAANLAKDIESAGGILTAGDIANYRPTVRSPVVSDNVHGFRIVGVPPPSSGGAAIVGAMRFLAGYVNPLASFPGTLSMHRMNEALKHVFSMRMSLRDPAFDDEENVDRNVIQDMTAGSYMEELRQLTPDNATLPLSYYGGKKYAQMEDTDGQNETIDAKEGDRRLQKARGRIGDRQDKRRLHNPFGYLNDRGTSHLSVIDKDGNAVAMTTSVNSYFGSCVRSQSTGVVLNNQMDDFSSPGKKNYFGLKPSEANYILPGKKPLSSMSPTMVFMSEDPPKLSNNDNDDSGNFGRIRMVLGGSGGPKIISAVLQVLINHVFLGKPLFDSIADPRVQNQLIYHESYVTTTENSIVHGPGLNVKVSNETKAALQKRGNRLLDIDYAGTVQAVSVDIDTGRLSAASDIRKGGSPAGY